MKLTPQLAGLLAATAGVAHLVLAAPQEAAATLAPGITCDGFACRNDTDDTYRVRSQVLCDAPGVSAVPRQSVVVDTYVPPRDTARISVACPVVSAPPTVEQRPGQLRADGTWEHTPPEVRPGPLVGTMATGVVHLSAEVDNGPRPDSGSGGA
ncbi:hypothetical protein [Nocardia sp. NPDC050718]|uniref:hypothetical protein n=1 Tax=Nocardia sp. NPDC050718 TaxID=3155788 RepID=UPI0033CEA49E